MYDFIYLIHVNSIRKKAFQIVADIVRIIDSNKMI